MQLSITDIANEVAKGKFSEATIGYRDKDAGDVWKRLFHKLTFRVASLSLSLCVCVLARG
jgi:glycerol-3-phosphate dehydrogenase (NAD+)